MPYYQYVMDGDAPALVWEDGDPEFAVALSGCKACHGRGYQGWARGCRSCLGTGKHKGEPCPWCRGSGKGKTEDEGYHLWCPCVTSEVSLTDRDKVR